MKYLEIGKEFVAKTNLLSHTDRVLAERGERLECTGAKTLFNGAEVFVMKRQTGYVVYCPINDFDRYFERSTR